MTAISVKETKKDQIFKWIVYFFLIVVLIIVLYPLFYIAIASISQPKFVNSGQVWLWPKGLNLAGYKLIFQDNDIWIGYRNTIFYTVVGVAINLFVTLPAAYALSRRDFFGRGFFMAMFVFTMFFSGGLIPTYLLVKKLGLVDTVWALLLPNAAAVWNIILTRTFFQSTIPKELEEAAKIDGCSNTKMFFKVVLPLSTPIIAVMALFYGVGHWNEYFNALIYLSNKNLYPLQMILRQILVLQSIVSNSVMTGSMAELLAKKQDLAAIMKYALMIVASLPLIIAYPFLQRYFVKGVMIGSLKG